MAVKLCDVKLTETRTAPLPAGWQYCRVEEAPTPHLTARVLLDTRGGWVLTQRCCRCGTFSLCALDQLPLGMRVYAARVVGEAGPNALGTPLPGFVEEFLTIGRSRQEAFERAWLALDVKPTGQQVRTYLDGEEHFDERF